MYIWSTGAGEDMQNRGYDPGQCGSFRSFPVPKQNVEQLTEFGRRFAALRKKSGYTQAELAQELGVSQRMISYYEGQSDYPPASLLPNMAKLLGVTTDELLGIKPLKKTAQPDSRMLRRMQQIEKLSIAKRKQIIQVIDTFIENEHLRQSLQQP